jgi:cobyrinic acid a,c-diamide synthase
MHYKKTFALAGVFLAVAIIVPVVVFSLQAQNDLMIIQNPAGIYTGGISNNATNNFQQIQVTHTNNLIIVMVVDAVFVSLFIVTMYFGIRHIHPSHKPEL